MVNRFRGKLTEKKYKREELATLWGVNVMTVSNKMTGKTSITCEELVSAVKYYELSDAELLYILFGESRLLIPVHESA